MNADAPSIRVEVVVHSDVGRTCSVKLSLPGGSTVQAALQQSGLCAADAAPNSGAMKVGVWGHVQRTDHVLRDLDRVEVYRPLLIEPMEARRRRQRAQARKSG